MPIFNLACVDACGADNIEIMTSYKNACSIKCAKCGGHMKVVPATSSFRIHGYSEANGYHRPTINYDGTES